MYFCTRVVSSSYIFMALLVVLVLPATAAWADEVRPMPAFQLTGVNNAGDISSEDYKEKVLIVSFWATWCPHCRKEAGDFVALSEKYKGAPFEIIGISMDKSGESVVLRFMERMKINYTIAMVTDQIKVDFGPIVGIPATFIIDKKGNIVDKKFGYIPKQKLIAMIDRLLAE